MNIQVVKAALVGLVLSVSSFANASLIKDNLTNIITDNTNTNQSLDWFSLTATTGYSFDEMVLELENQESKFYGFSYATFSDLTTLFSNTGWVTSINDHTKPKNGRTAMLHSNSTYGELYRAALTSLIVKFGATSTNRAAGMYNTTDGIRILDFRPEAGSNSLILSGFTEETYNFDFGHWLVRTTPVNDNATSVPEPSTLAIVA